MQATAERLGVMHLLDKRFAGVAKGVGSGKILGRIHQVHTFILSNRERPSQSPLS
jgi:Aspartyl protease